MSFISAIADAFKGAEKPRAPLAGTFISPWASAYNGRGGRYFDYGAALKAGFSSNPVAQRAVRIVAEGVGSAPLIQRNAEVERLIGATSAGQSLIETIAAHLALHGNAYVQILKDGSGQISELFALRPERMTICPDPEGWPHAYEYAVGSQTMHIPLADANLWPNIIHIRSFHPGDDHYGAGALEAAEAAIAIHNAASEWNRSLLDNAARPSGALVFDNNDGAALSTAQFERLKAELLGAYQGQMNAGRPLILEGGLKWQSMALSPADMDFATLKSAAARDIALAFGVPPMLLGLPGDNTYSNYKEANRALWRLTLLPLADKILKGLAEGLAPWFPDLSLSVDLDRIAALSEDRERLWTQVNDAKFLSDDEKRALLGFVNKDSDA